VLLLLRLDDAEVVQNIEIFRLPVEQPDIKRFGLGEPPLSMQCKGLSQELIV
jgi:hypothetical protein